MADWDSDSDIMMPEGVEILELEEELSTLEELMLTPTTILVLSTPTSKAVFEAAVAAELEARDPLDTDPKGNDGDDGEHGVASGDAAASNQAGMTATTDSQAADDNQAGASNSAATDSAAAAAAAAAATAEAAAAETAAAEAAAATAAEAAAAATEAAEITLQARMNIIEDLFSKVRYSYDKEATRERYISLLIGNPHEVTDPVEDAQLDYENSVSRLNLCDVNYDMLKMAAALDELSNELSYRHAEIKLKRVRIKDLLGPGEGIAHLEGKVVRLRAEITEAGKIAEAAVVTPADKAADKADARNAAAGMPAAERPYHKRLAKARYIADKRIRAQRKRGMLQSESFISDDYRAKETAVVMTEMDRREGRYVLPTEDEAMDWMMGSNDVNCAAREGDTAFSTSVRWWQNTNRALDVILHSAEHRAFINELPDMTGILRADGSVTGPPGTIVPHGNRVPDGAPVPYAIIQEDGTAPLMGILGPHGTLIPYGTPGPDGVVLQAPPPRVEPDPTVHFGFVAGPGGVLELRVAPGAGQEQAATPAQQA